MKTLLRTQFLLPINNNLVADHPGVDCVMLPISDGLTLLRKR